MTDDKTAHRVSPSEETHPASWSEEKLLAHCRLTFSRARGPGGQNRNKVETSVQIEYLPNKIIASASERRTQNENRKVALQRLRCKLAVEIRRTPWLDSHKLTVTQASMVAGQETTAFNKWQLYCRDGRIDIADTNTDWPEVLAELIGVLSHSEWNLQLAASFFKSSSSQLVKLLKKYPPAFALLNHERRTRGQRPLD